MRKLLLTLIAVFTASFASAQTELLTNGSFEEWSEDYPTSWKSASTASSTATVQQSTDARTGTYAVEIKGITSGNKRLASAEMTLEPGTYTFSIWMKSAGEASVSKIGYVPIADGKVKTYVYPKENGSEIELNLTSTYTQYTNTFTLTETTTLCLVVMNNKKSNAVSIIADDASLTTSDGGEGEGGGDDTETIANTPETAYTATQALEILASDADLTPNVYVKGTVAAVTEINTEYGNATFDITDGTSTLTIFRAKYLEGTTFSNEDQLQDGDDVIAYGQLKNYKKDDVVTPELTNGYTYSINGQTKIGSGEETETMTVAEAQALTSGKAKVNVTVYAVCKTGAVFGDATGYIYYYNSSISDIAVGDQLTVEGALSKYGGFNQFTNAATITKTGTTTVSYPTAETIDIDAWVAAPAIKFVKLQGVLNISGNYYNIAVDGKTAQGSVIGALSDMFGNVTSGSTITIEGFAMYTSGSGKYANIVVTKLTVDSEGETVDITNTPETAYTVSEARALVDAGKGLDQSVYVKGKISEIVSLDVTKWKRAQYDIMEETGTKMRIFNGYYLEGKDFTSDDQIKVGDEVVVYGQLTLYTPKEGDPIYEMAANNYIYSQNGNTNGVGNVKAAQQDGPIYDLAGRCVEKAVKGIYIMNGKKFVK